MAHNDYMSATELRELIKENAVVLFAYEVGQLYGQHPGVLATDTFVIFITRNPDPPSYEASINHVGSGKLKWVARSAGKLTVVEALRSLLDTTAQAIHYMNFVGQEMGDQREWARYGEGIVRDV
ncbi:hypothetical protein LTR10_007313 [Elasticomyces elasticus]|nr:hypothetical protein LTR10_007313 [Elasticomyces elasticus]KAK4979125.1 hypothetical protein LTR42_001627 [Elasticomyces elasticus]